MTLYERVAEQIEGFIVKGIHEPGERLPSIRRLARQMGVSRSGSGCFVDHLSSRTGTIAAVGGIARELADKASRALAAPAV